MPVRGLQRDEMVGQAMMRQNMRKAAVRLARRHAQQPAIVREALQDRGDPVEQRLLRHRAGRPQVEEGGLVIRRHLPVQRVLRLR